MGQVYMDALNSELSHLSECLTNVWKALREATR